MRLKINRANKLATTTKRITTIFDEKGNLLKIEIIFSYSL
jgi:hypothetical protein